MNPNGISKKTALAGIMCFLIGAACMFGVQKLLAQPAQLEKSHGTQARSMDPVFDHFFNDDFFDQSQDPFEEMRKMRKRMLSELEDTEEEGLFDSWYQKKFGGGNAAEINQRQDHRYIYYDIAISGLRPDKVNIEVQNGQITISGKTQKRSKKENVDSYSSSTFHRSFPVPPNVESSKVTMEQLENKIVIKFPKILESH